MASCKYWQSYQRTFVGFFAKGVIGGVTHPQPFFPILQRIDYHQDTGEDKKKFVREIDTE